MSEMLPKINSIWRHTKSDADYVIVGHCLVEATLAPAIVYRGGHGYALDGAVWKTWVRPASEFMDGRFVFVGF